MKAYGFSSNSGKVKKLDLGFEDVLSIQIGGRKTSFGCKQSKVSKAESRRYFKRLERKNNKISILNF